MDLAVLLKSAILGTSTKERQLAEAQLKQAETQEFIPFLAALTKTLDDENLATEVRMLACIALKNVLSSHEPREIDRKTKQWITLDPGAKSQIKSVALKALLTQDARVGRSAAQLVSAIANIDLPRGEWNDLIGILTGNTAEGQPDHVKVASLKAIGYTCETTDPTNAVITSQSSGILVAILQGINSETASSSVKEAALDALVNSLEFVRANFESKEERDYIMTAVCSSTQSNQENVQLVAFAALNKIMALYYENMRDYMEPALFPLSASAIKSDNEGIVMLALEFWSTICELEEPQYDGERLVANSVNFGFASQAIPVIIPRVLETMVNEDEDAADDEWNTAMSAASTLELFARACGDAIVQPTIDFVGTNITSSEWNKREAAVMAFGSILDGPNTESLATLTQQAMQPILTLIGDSSLAVKDTVSWCLGRICDLLSFAIDPNTQLQPLVEALLIGMKDHPKVSTNCCWAFMNLVEQLQGDAVGKPRAIFSPYYDAFFDTLVNITSRANNEASARTSAYEALSSLIVFSSDDALPMVIIVAQQIVPRLQETLPIQQHIAQNLENVSADDRNNLEELQSSLLGVLANVIRRAESSIKDAANDLMNLCFQLLQSRLPNSLIDDDVLVVMGAIGSAIGESFLPYMDPLMTFVVEDALKKPEISLAHTAVGLISDCCLAVGKNIQPYVGAIMQSFVDIFQQEHTYPKLKPALLSCIGDIASYTGTGFRDYLVITMNILHEASMLRVDSGSSLEFSEYVYSLRDSILDAYVGIVAGFAEAPEVLAPYISNIFGFLAYIHEDEFLMSKPSVMNSLVGLLGDISAMYPNGEISRNYREKWVSNIIEIAYRSGNSKLETTAAWAKAQLKIQLSLVN